MTSPLAGAPLPKAAIALIWLNAISVTVLVGGELFAVLLSLDWALAGFFGLAAGANYVLLAVLMAVCAAASWAVFRRAIAAERQLAAGEEPKGQE